MFQPQNPSSPISFLRQNWLWLTIVVMLLVAFLVAFLQVKKQKRRLRAAYEMLDSVLEKSVSATEEITDVQADQPAQTEAELPNEPQPNAQQTAKGPVGYELPVMSPGLHYKVRPMPSPYEGATQMEAWDNLRFKFVRLTHDPQGRVAQPVREAMQKPGNAWVLELCHHTGKVWQTSILPLAQEEEQAIPARLNNAIRTLLAMNLPEEAQPETT